MTDLIATASNHVVNLTWTQSTTSGITSNNVYRSTTNGSGYAVIATVSPAGVSYSDSTISPGNTYYYVVTALEGTFESPFSNQATAVIPNTPNAPTGLTATVS